MSARKHEIESALLGYDAIDILICLRERFTGSRGTAFFLMDSLCRWLGGEDCSKDVVAMTAFKAAENGRA